MCINQSIEMVTIDNEFSKNIINNDNHNDDDDEDDQFFFLLLASFCSTRFLIELGERKKESLQKQNIKKTLQQDNSYGRCFFF